MSDSSLSAAKPVHKGSAQGRWWLVGMGLFLAMAGMLFTWVLWRAFTRAEETRSWVETPCRIVGSLVRSERPSPNSNMSHRAEVRYVYEFGGQNRTGSRVKRVDGATTHEERAQAVVAAYPVGMQTVCYVNPAQPAEAVLKQGSRGALYSIWFPLLFVVGGLGVAVNALRASHQ
jgi:hypothetical protein